MVDNRFQPESAPGRPAGHRLVEPLREYASPATGCGAAKSADRNPQLNGTAVGRQVEEPPLIEVLKDRGIPFRCAGRTGPAGNQKGGPVSRPSNTVHPFY
jgi:hypothetical protein